MVTSFDDVKTWDLETFEEMILFLVLKLLSICIRLTLSALIDQIVISNLVAS